MKKRMTTIKRSEGRTMSTANVQKGLNSVTKFMLRKVSISLLVALMVFSLIPLASTASAQPSTSFSPTYTGSYSNNDYLELYFSDDFTVNNPDEISVTDSVYLKSQMSIATDGVNFVSLPERSDVYTGGNYVEIYYDDYRPIVLGGNTLIKIASGALMDHDGNLNPEMILDVSPPVIQSAVISPDNHDVTITFQKAVYSSVSDLKQYIRLYRNGSDSGSNSLDYGDSTTIDASGNLVVHFANALTGANNQIVINSGALKDGFGNVQRQRIVTPFIQANAATTPRLLDVYVSNSNHNINLVFDRDVESNIEVDSGESIRDYIEYYDSIEDEYVWLTDMSLEDVTVTFSGHTMIIQFKNELKIILRYISMKMLLKIQQVMFTVKRFIGGDTPLRIH